MDSARKDFGTTIATLARLYKEAQASGDARRAKVYAKAVDVLLDAWPSEPEPADLAGQPPSHSRLRAALLSHEKTLVGLGTSPSREPRVSSRGRKRQ
jgi:hypothetical protein